MVEKNPTSAYHLFNINWKTTECHIFMPRYFFFFSFKTEQGALPTEPTPTKVVRTVTSLMQLGIRLEVAPLRT